MFSKSTLPANQIDLDLAKKQLFLLKFYFFHLGRKLVVPIPDLIYCTLAPILANVALDRQLYRLGLDIAFAPLHTIPDFYLLMFPFLPSFGQSLSRID